MNKHLLVCDRQSRVVFLLTVIHASRDIPSRLAEIAPTLAAEAELLHKQLRRSERRPRSQVAQREVSRRQGAGL